MALDAVQALRRIGLSADDVGRCAS